MTWPLHHYWRLQHRNFEALIEALKNKKISKSLVRLLIRRLRKIGIPIPPELEQGIIDAYQNHYTNYPAAEGNLDLRETLSAFIQERQKLNYSINEIVVAAASVKESGVAVNSEILRPAESSFNAKSVFVIWSTATDTVSVAD